MSRDLANQVNQLQKEQYLSLIWATLESTADGILVVTRDRNTPIYNQKFLQLWGISEELMQSGKADQRLDYLAAQTTDPQGFLDRVWELFRDRPDVEALDILEFKDGRTIERYSQPQRIGDEIVGRVWSFRDITKRRRAEEALRQSEARNRAIVSAIPDLMFLYNSDGYFVDFVRSNREVDFLDGTVDRTGKHLNDFLPQEVATLQLRAIRETLATGKVQVYEQEFLFEERWHYEEVRISPYSEDIVLVMVRDISDRKRSEAERQQLEDALAERAVLSAFRADVSSALARSESLPLILNRCTKAVIKHLNAAFARIWILNPSENMLELQASAGTYTHLDGAHSRIPVGHFKIGKIAQAGHPLLTNDVLNDANISDPAWAKREKMVAFAGCPILLGNQLLGVIAMFARQPISTSTFEALGFAANQIALGIRRKQTEDALRQAEERYRSIFENSVMGIFQSTVDGHYLNINPTLARMHGYSSCEAMMSDMNDIGRQLYVNPDRRQQFICLTDANGIITEFESEVYRKDGSIIWVSENARAVRDADGNTLYFEGNSIEISERKQAEEALRKSEAKLAEAQQIAHVGNWEFDLHTGKITWSTEAFHIHGFDPTQPEPSYAEFQTLIHPDDREALILAIDHAIADGKPYSLDYQLTRPDGSLCCAEARGQVLFNAEGQVTHLYGTCLDVTERKQSEEALRQSQQLLNTVVENLPIALYTKDVRNQFRYVLMNKSSEKILGFAKEQAIGHNDYELIADERAEHYRTQDLAAIAQRSLLEFVEYTTPPNSTEGIYLRGFKVPLFDSYGQATHLVCIGEDVTERRQAEEAQQRRAMEDNLLSCISRQFMDHDADTAIQFTLEVIARFIGSDRSVIFEYFEQHRKFSAVYQWCANGITPLPNMSSTLEDFPWFYRPILNGEVVQVTNVADLPPAAVNEKAMLEQLQIQSFISVPMVYAGRVVGFLGSDTVHRTRAWSLDDVSLLRRVGELIAIGQARYKAEETFSKAFRSSPSPIAIITLADNRFVEVNTSFLRLCGCTQTELIGHDIADLNLGIAQEHYQSALQQALQTGSLNNQEFEFRTQSGSFRTVLLSIELINLGGTQCTLNIVNDITERKRLENELISLVSHELRTPMTSLLGALDLLGSGRLGTLTPQGQQVLCIATNNTERLTRLVNDILDLERMRSGKITMQKSTCSAADLMIQASETMQAMAEQAQITLITEPVDVELQVDSDRILQTLTNLLSNAIKFSEAGSTVWLAAKKWESGRVEEWESGKSHPPIHPSTHSPILIFSVKDHGRGIPQDKLQLIFDRFQQVDASDSRKKGGTGLGLAICRNIVEQHNGKIWAESTLGQGSTFHVLLPLELSDDR